MPSRPTVFLFDIDGTLVSTGGAGRRAVERAFEAFCGRPEACAQVPFAGMTDPLIMGLGLQALGLEDEPEARDRLVELYLGFLRDELPRSPHYRVHPSIEDTLHQLSTLPQVALGLGTGNVERGARVKLAPADLNRWFDFGGFGSDHAVRAELIRAGARRGAARLGAPVEACRVVIIGDTPLDIAAAHAVGGECLAVATGSYREAPLQEAGAELVVADLSDPRALAFLLGE